MPIHTTEKYCEVVAEKILIKPTKPYSKTGPSNIIVSCTSVLPGFLSKSGLDSWIQKGASSACPAV